MISRIWHAYTLPNNADAFEALLLDEIFPGIARRQIPGYHGIELARRDIAGEVEFTTIMWFDSIDNIRTFSGSDYELAVVPPKARPLLTRFEERAAHYEVRKPRG